VEKMIQHVFNNKLKLIYEHRPGNLTSFCIGFEAGALMETGYCLGTAHAVEHMLFKGTQTRSEYEINKFCDNVFGFNNAMTNYPYCIYYGTTLNEDFFKGFELYSDIILNPLFPEKGYKEEIDVITEELKEWKDDITQFCEDELFYNAFENIRIKNLIIGTEESVKAITLQDIKRFYNQFYVPENCAISVVSSLDFKEVLYIVETLFGNWNKSYDKKNLLLYETNQQGYFETVREGINGAKLQFIYPINELSPSQLKALSIFNQSFGEGTSSLLYDEVRTKRGLAYEVGSSIKAEKGIKLFSINLGTSSVNIDTSVEIISDIIERIKRDRSFFSDETIRNNARMIRLKRELRLEKSIILCKELSTYELMFGNASVFLDEVEGLHKITEQDINEVINLVLLRPTIQIVKP
jgi:predicted Zn-dependent peptidase